MSDFRPPDYLSRVSHFLAFFLRVQERLTELGIPTDEGGGDDSESYITRKQYRLYREYRQERTAITWAGVVGEKDTPTVEVTVQWGIGYELFLVFQHPSDGFTLRDLLATSGFVGATLDVTSWSQDNAEIGTLYRGSPAFEKLDDMQMGGKLHSVDVGLDLIADMVAFFRDRVANPE